MVVESKPCVQGRLRKQPAQATVRRYGGNKTCLEVSHMVGSNFECRMDALLAPNLLQGLEWQPEYAATLAAYYNASLDTLTSAKASAGFVRCSDGLGTARPARPVPNWPLLAVLRQAGLLVFTSAPGSCKGLESTEVAQAAAPCRLHCP